MNEPQEDAQTAQAVIAAVLMEHGRRIDPNHPGYGNCRCGFVVDLPQDQAGHVAAVLTAALGLTPEWGVITDMGYTYGTARWTEELSRRAATKFDDMTARRRFVTKWEQQA